MTARQDMERLNPASIHTFQLDMGHPEVYEHLYYYNAFAQTVALEDLHHLSNMRDTTLWQKFSQVPIMAQSVTGSSCRANISGNLKLDSFYTFALADIVFTREQVQVDHSTGSIASISPSPSRRTETWISLSKKLSQPRIAHCLALFHETCPSTGMLVAEERIDATYLQLQPHTSATLTSQQYFSAYRDKSYSTRKRYTN
ncbi:hypothetical protein HBI56_161760 [Parastagonospora nodorum]|nr:hypothetical protein HBI10_186510 [Parastagonospora nodorum]KAH4014315.1 hypothetical protein HBI13_172500 [Parastagonospora nodorum]KAH4022515.1 hypothetical protein HBI09_170530 [Parastagonospora nodorum]KAH4171543.1 hypothetical protein HBH43_100350 [Parastagonospora nodorum]KAH4206815.1 hypothetical protein HBI95_120940 [Parastagonospora nodorum]